ncbi:MAG: hypothetical protein NQU41_00490 [Candidatus Methanosuratincola sp.]|uniref:Uncharacterized protein n=1 Tax=Methanosuratincola subterraneus TaxID=2593994 RepID=A0A3S3SSW0_METS7|nr:hypothetical protein [Candidatus Methanosuratincola sp.]RWX74037.1 MAG: hypothetical protein Metus_0062 [Candidatus Methanosuratincola subterraneus]
MIALAVPPAAAHSPIIAGGNDSLDRAISIDDPAKSWAIFSRIPGGWTAQFYKFDMNEGERIYSVLQISPEAKESGFSPLIAIIGPGMPDPPEGLPFQVPEGSGVLVIEGVPADSASYEGFTPTVFFRVASYSSPAPATGTYYLAVFSGIPGSYSLAIGYKEEFTPYEWVMIPINQILIYLWSGQSPLAVLAPMALVVMIGVLFLLWKWCLTGPICLPKALTAVASLFYIGTGAIILNQIAYASKWVELGPEVGITLVFAALPVMLGIAALRKAQNWSPSTRSRLSIFALGALGLLLWAGALVGPSIMMIASILPGRSSNR